MLRAFTIVGCLLSLQIAQAEWTVSSPKRVPTRHAAIEHLSTEFIQGEDRVDANVVTFNRNKAEIRVVDLAPGRFVSDAVGQNHGLAGVNGGYFQPDHSPLGLVVSGGKKLSPLAYSKILTGLLVVTSHGPSLLRVEEFHSERKLREALQAGPFLVDHGKPVAGLNATRSASRTVLLANKNGVCALLSTGPMTLADLAQALTATPFIPGIKIDRALNLDGGSSTALWVDDDPTPFSIFEWKHVRNAVVIVPSR